MCLHRISQRNSWVYLLPQIRRQDLCCQERILSGETVLREHLWGRGPFVCPVRGRREHKEEIEASTRAVYPGSGRDGRVKPYSCLVCIELGSSGAWRTSYTERISVLGRECGTPSTLHTGLLL